MADRIPTRELMMMVLARIQEEDGGLLRGTTPPSAALAGVAADPIAIGAEALRIDLGQGASAQQKPRRS